VTGRSQVCNRMGVTVRPGTAVHRRQGANAGSSCGCSRESEPGFRDSKEKLWGWNQGSVGLSVGGVADFLRLTRGSPGVVSTRHHPDACRKCRCSGRPRPGESEAPRVREGPAAQVSGPVEAGRLALSVASGDGMRWKTRAPCARAAPVWGSCAPVG